MGIKKIARPINKSKNEFVEWLKENEATNIEVYEGDDSPLWDYYRVISGFVGDNLITVDFQMWMGKIRINYRDDENSYVDMSIDEFSQMIS